jgi:hypothetical protein
MVRHTLGAPQDGLQQPKKTHRIYPLKKQACGQPFRVKNTEKRLAAKFNLSYLINHNQRLI